MQADAIIKHNKIQAASHGSALKICIQMQYFYGHKYMIRANENS